MQPPDFDAWLGQRGAAVRSQIHRALVRLRTSLTTAEEVHR